MAVADEEDLPAWDWNKRELFDGNPDDFGGCKSLSPRALNSDLCVD